MQVRLPAMADLPCPSASLRALRRAMGDLVDHLRFFGILAGPPGRAELRACVPSHPKLVLLFVALGLAVMWINTGGMTASGTGGTFPARPELVDDKLFILGILVSLRACTVSLVQADLTTASTGDGSPASLMLYRIEIQTIAGGYALAAATVATQEVWRCLPLVDQDAGMMARSVHAAGSLFI